MHEAKPTSLQVTEIIRCLTELAALTSFCVAEI